MWGGPFAILTPPPCMKPHNLQVHQQQHYDSVLLTWEMPSGVSFCRLEYGPAGFTPGSGTVVNGITDEHYMIGGLAASTEYDFRVSGWCIYDSAFSATTDTTYTTPEACTSKFQTDITGVTDSSFTVKWRLPDGSAYGELLYGVQGFGEDEGTLVSPVLPDSTGWCSVHLTGLQSGTSYELHIRNWCPYGDVFSPYDIQVARTIAHYTVTAVPNNPAWGSVSGSGEYLEGTQATLVATPTAGGPFHFAVWSDGVTSRVRAISVTQDISLTALFVCDTCTEGIGDPAVRLTGGSDVSIFPNPASGTVTLLSPSLLETVEFYSMDGRMLLQKSVIGNVATLDISSLPAGSYLMRIHTTNGVANKRLVVK